MKPIRKKRLLTSKQVITKNAYMLKKNGTAMIILLIWLYLYMVSLYGVFESGYNKLKKVFLIYLIYTKTNYTTLSLTTFYIIIFYQVLKIACVSHYK